MIIIENIDHISLAVSDIEASIEFYRENFGFDLIEHVSGSPEAVLQVGEIRLRLISGDKGEKGAGYVAFYVDEEDFEDALEEVDEAELEVVSGPESIKGGKRIIIADPDGNRIALCSSAK